MSNSAQCASRAQQWFLTHFSSFEHKACSAHFFSHLSVTTLRMPICAPQKRSPARGEPTRVQKRRSAASTGPCLTMVKSMPAVGRSGAGLNHLLGAHVLLKLLLVHDPQLQRRLLERLALLVRLLGGRRRFVVAHLLRRSSRDSQEAPGQRFCNTVRMTARTACPPKADMLSEGAAWHAQGSGGHVVETLSVRKLARVLAARSVALHALRALRALRAQSALRCARQGCTRAHMHTVLLRRVRRCSAPAGLHPLISYQLLEGMLF